MRTAVTSLAVALAGLVAMEVGSPGAAVATVIVLAVLAGSVVHRLDARRADQLLERVRAWRADAGPPPRPDGRESTTWRRLARELDALGEDHRQRGEELERARPWRHELVSSLVQPALLFSSEGRLLEVNAEARQLLGIPASEQQPTVLEAVGSVALADTVAEARRSDQPVTVDVEHGDHDLRAVASQVGTETLLVITDRTRERRVEELRRNFVVNASHELKTPVTSIQTLAEALEVAARDSPERTVPLVNRLGKEAERLARLVRDLLDLRRLEDREPMEHTSVDLAELCRITVAELLPRAEERGVTIGLEAPDRAVVRGTAGDLETIVKNLVANALQYNRDDGSIEVRIEPRGESQVLSVADTGIGIPQQDLTRIFERFYRVDAARSRETGGTGLGLSIVRHAVQRHGGSIRVESLLGEGTTFTVTLPVEPPAEPTTS